MSIRAIAGKDIRLILRDPRSVVVLLFMPLVLILVLGLSVGDMLSRKPDDRLRVSVVIEDEGLPPDPKRQFPLKAWSELFCDDLADTANIRVERVASREEAKRLLASRERAAVVLLKREFSDRAQRCSFVGDDFKTNPINPLYRDGIRTEVLGVEILTDPTQPVGAAVIGQVVQVSLVRIIIPWMIGQAFDLIGTERFLEKMEKYMPSLPGGLPLPPWMKEKIGDAMKKGIENFFGSYKFTSKTWAGLTRSGSPEHHGENRLDHTPPAEGFGIHRGSVRYQILVPSYTVTFAFFLVLTTGRLFVDERRHGTMTRLRLAPTTRGSILVGKFLPSYAISLMQGILLFGAGRLFFGLSWGEEPWRLIPVLAATSLAATGLSLLVAGLARTESQVAVYGTLTVLLLAGLGGAMMPREMMPEEMRRLSLVTPHAWALDAYSRLLAGSSEGVGLSCLVLTAFGIVYCFLAYLTAKLD